VGPDKVCGTDEKGFPGRFVNVPNEKQQVDLLERFRREGVECKALVS
jgi:hypothetical protein